MITNFIVVDDFLRDPDALRAEALTLDYPTLEEKTYFPGRNSMQRIPVRGLDEQISKLVKHRLQAVPGTSHTKFRIALADDVGSADVHIDNSHWTGLLYLTPDALCPGGGTNFYRHKETGTDVAPLNAVDWEPLGFKDAEDVWTNLIRRDTNDMDAWEKTFHIPMRYNRLVLFRPWHWHNPSPGFGTSVETGRLIYSVFYHEV